jgi:hypothetical protein
MILGIYDLMFIGLKLLWNHFAFRGLKWDFWRLVD